MPFFVAACAAPATKFKADADLALERVRVSNMETLFPVETVDFYRTVQNGDSELISGNVRKADLYYALALGKAELLESFYRQELKKKEEAIRLEFELKRKAEEELERRKILEREMAAVQAREAVARARKLEAENRQRAESARREKEVQPVTRHTVKRGETLPQIAALPEVYGDASLWPLIYKSNRDQISNPAVVWPGQVLRISRNFDKNDISEARRFSSGRPLR